MVSFINGSTAHQFRTGPGKQSAAANRFVGFVMDNRLIDILKSIHIIKNVETGVIQSQSDWHCLLDEIMENLENNENSFLTRDIM